MQIYHQNIIKVNKETWAITSWLKNVHVETNIIAWETIIKEKQVNKVATSYWIVGIEKYQQQ